MYNHAIIRKGFKGLIGFESSYNSAHPNIDYDLTTSISGLYINNSLHPLITPDNIMSVVEQFSKVSVRSHDTEFNYKVGDVVKVGNTHYQSIVANNIANDVTDSTKWRKTNLYSSYLRRLYDASVLKFFNSVFTEKKLSQVAKTLFGNVKLFEGVGNLDHRITKSNRLVGYKLTVKHPHTIAIIHSIGLQLDTAQEISLYLYHSSSNEPIKTFTLNHTRSISYQSHAIENEILSHMSDNVTVGPYYLCYYESDLIGQAIKKNQYSFAGDMRICGSCSEALLNQKLFNVRSPFIEVQPFYVNEGNYIKGYLHSDDKEFHIVDSNFGINLQISIQSDVSNFLCQNKLAFVNGIAQQIIVDLLQEMNFSTRDNQLQGKLAQMSAVALDNRENGEPGEVKKLSKAISAVSFDLTELNMIGLRSNQQSGGFGSIYR